ALRTGTRSGFLVALKDLVHQSIAAQAHQAEGRIPFARTSVAYVYFGVFYDLTMKSSVPLRAATIDGRTYNDVVRSDFEIRNRSDGETSRFQLTYGTRGALAGVPIHAIYRPRWWFEVQLFLDDKNAF